MTAKHFADVGRGRCVWIWIWIAVLCGWAFACAAHPDLIEQINQLTAQMGTDGPSAAALAERADLYRRHAQFDEALADLAVAERFGTNAPGLALARARIFSDAGKASAALEAVQTFLRHETNEPEAWFIRARSEAMLGRPQAAIDDYTAAINLSRAPVLEAYLERARQQAVLGRLEDAVRGLDEGMVQLSPLPILQMRAIQYDRKRKSFDSALKRVDSFLERYPVKEPWLTLRAEVLEEAGRTAAARAAFREVIAGIENYSPDRRALDLTKELEARARKGLARTEITLAKISKP